MKRRSLIGLPTRSTRCLMKGKRMEIRNGDHCRPPFWPLSSCSRMTPALSPFYDISSFASFALRSARVLAGSSPAWRTCSIDDWLRERIRDYPWLHLCSVFHRQSPDKYLSCSEASHLFGMRFGKLSRSCCLRKSGCSLCATRNSVEESVCV